MADDKSYYHTFINTLKTISELNEHVKLQFIDPFSVSSYEFLDKYDKYDLKYGDLFINCYSNFEGTPTTRRAVIELGELFEFSNDGKGGKMLAFKDEQGAIRRNAENKLNPFTASELISMELKDYGTLKDDDYLVIQATSVGLYPNCEDVVLADEAFYKKVKAGVDLIYNPETTKFMKLLQSQEKKAMNGMKMLLYQGIIAYELWNDCKVSEELAEEVLKKMKEELK